MKLHEICQTGKELCQCGFHLKIHQDFWFKYVLSCVALDFFSRLPPTGYCRYKIPIWKNSKDKCTQYFAREAECIHMAKYLNGIHTYDDIIKISQAGDRTLWAISDDWLYICDKSKSLNTKQDSSTHGKDLLDW